jgi:hypothetical protein
MQQLGIEQRDHYGLRYLIHSWISFAIRRRSFSLLSRASKLAAQLGISMDDIFCTSMGFLPDILLTTAQQQTLSPLTQLHWEDIPVRLLEATGSSNESGPSSRDERWIWIREMDKGMSRYLLSDAFARDVASLQLVNETWQRNERAVVDLFLVAQCKHTQAFAHQISLFQNANRQLECTRLNQLQLKTQTQGIVEVDQLACLDIVDMNRSFYFLEYVPRSTDGRNQAGDHLSDLSFVHLDSLLDTGDDAELQLFLDLMEADMDATNTSNN